MYEDREFVVTSSTRVEMYRKGSKEQVGAGDLEFVASCLSVERARVLRFLAWCLR